MTRSALEAIRQNIAQYGYHAYLIVGTSSPRYLYTIGLSEAIGAELMLAGAAYYTADEAEEIVRRLAQRLRRGEALDNRFTLRGHGTFELRRARKDWVASLMLGALDYYDRAVSTYQIVPDDRRSTADVPDMRKPKEARANRAWTWFEKKWAFPVPADSMATTNLAALRGSRVTEAARWELDEWELFAGAGPDVKPEEARSLPLGVLLGLDPSLQEVAALEVGQALWRNDSDGAWNQWVRRQPG